VLLCENVCRSVRPMILPVINSTLYVAMVFSFFVFGLFIGDILSANVDERSLLARYFAV